MSKIVVKQGLEGGLGYCANVPMAIVKSDFDGGVAACAHKWKASDIRKRNPAGGLHAEKKQ